LRSRIALATWFRWLQGHAKEPIRSRAHVTTPFSPIDRLANRHIASSILTRLRALKGTDAERYQAAVDLIVGALDAASARVRS
jgi:hypothetical protein